MKNYPAQAFKLGSVKRGVPVEAARLTQIVERINEDFGVYGVAGRWVETNMETQVTDFGVKFHYDRRPMDGVRTKLEWAARKHWEEWVDECNSGPQAGS